MVEIGGFLRSGVRRLVGEGRFKCEMAVGVGISGL